MASRKLRENLEKWKNGGTVSSDDDEDDQDNHVADTNEIYDEEEQDNYCEDDDDLDDFVVNDADTGYKASAHQQRDRVRRQQNRSAQSNIKRQRNTQSTQSYNIQRKKRRNDATANTTNNNNTNKPSSTQAKSQATISSFFGKASTQSTSNRHKTIINNNKKTSIKTKSNKKKSDDAFMEDLLADMDDDDDDDDDVKPIVNQDDNDHYLAGGEQAEYTEPQTQFTVPAVDNMDDDIDVDGDDDLDNECFPDTQTSVQSHAPARHVAAATTVAVCEPVAVAVAPSSDEPPKKRFRLNETETLASTATALESKQMEEEPAPEADEVGVTPGAEEEDEDANTDQFPQSKPGFLDFFWFDAYEDPIRHPGQIYLFGKTLINERDWQSVCVLIRNIARTVYVLPRLKNAADDIETGERVDFQQVYKEINEKRAHLGISKFMAKPEEKKYCFRQRANGVPAQCTYLKVCYSFDESPFVGRGCESGATYERVFGVRSTALELFLLEKQVMGPCWLRVPYTRASKIVSWCKHELEIDEPVGVSLLSTNYPSPSLTVLSLSFQTVLNEKKEHEIGCISAVVEHAVGIDHSKRHHKATTTTAGTTVEYFTLIRKMDRNPLPYDLEPQLARNQYKVGASTLKTFSSERDLLSFFTTRIQNLDPDVLLGHKLYDFVLDVILHRMQVLKISTWSKLGRLRRGKIPFMKDGSLIRKWLGCGRLLVDTFISAQEFQHHKTYSLSFLAQELLGVAKHENLNAQKLRAHWLDGKQLAKVVLHCCNDSHLILQLMHKLQVLPLTKQLTNLCGNLWNRSLTSQRAERNEWLLLHEFHRSGYIVPERLTVQEKIDAGIVTGNAKSKKQRGKAQYSGGLVLEPIKGLYDKFVLCLDFNSLYPSIIQEYNLCFTSMQHWRFSNENAAENENEKRQQESSSAPEVGILPKVIGVLLTRRSTVKSLLKHATIESEKKRFDIQQQALKLVANSMYGCLGFEHSRFYCKCIASLITALGRDALTKAAEMAQTIDNLQVIYGDTDSIFIYTDCDNLLQARAYGKEIKKKVNKTYKKMYLEIDYVFSKMLLCRKKKYAAIKVISFEPRDGSNMKTMREVKGLDFVRRDWSVISHDVGGKVLDVILAQGKQIDEVVEEIYELLRAVKKDMDENRVELKKFIITKKLTKQPKDYPDPSKQPHVMVAMQMQKMGMSVQTGAFIEYIICTTNRDGSDSGGGGSSKSIAQRAYHIKEIEKSMQNGSDGGGEDADAGTQVLHVDRTWYLEQQILPPVTRYCDPIPGADMAQIARALGLDGNKFAHLGTSGTGGGGGTRTGGADEDDLDMEDKILRITDRLKYRETCAPLKIECKHCGSSYDFSGVFDFNKMDATCGLVCATSNCKGIVCVSDKSVEDKALRQRDLACLKNGIALQIWHFIYAYYAREWICIDPTCNYKTRQLSSTGNGDKCPKIGCNSHLKETYTASQLFDQLKYFLFLFDRIEFGKILKQETANNKKWNNVTLTTTQTEILDELHAWIKKTILQKSRYYFLDSNLLFKYLGSS